MLRKTVVPLLTASTTALAHGKPFPHGHIGFFHPEDILMILVVFALLVGGFRILYKLR